MPTIREETLNSHLALLFHRYEGISATAERRSRTKAIDISVQHAGSTAELRILIEAKIGTTPSKRRAAAAQARSRLRDSPHALAFGLCYPERLRDGSLFASQTESAIGSSAVVFAPVRLFGDNPA